MVDVEVYSELTEPDEVEVGQLLENRLLQASTVHADDLPALKEPTTVGVQKLVEQHWHLQSPVVDVVAGGGLGDGGDVDDEVGGGGLGDGDGQSDSEALVLQYLPLDLQHPKVTPFRPSVGPSTKRLEPETEQVVDKQDDILKMYALPSRELSRDAPTTA